MNIPDEAIEAAANAISECSGMRFDGFWSRIEDLEPEDREYALTEARAAIEAAAPHIAAQALRDASEAYPLETAYGGAEHAVLWLKERAEQFEAVPTGAASFMSTEEP